MTLGDILEQAARRDLAGNKLLRFEGGTKSPLRYEEWAEKGNFKIKLSSSEDQEAFVECSVPDDETEETRNYCRLYFLSMVFNAAIYGMKRKKQNETKK